MSSGKREAFLKRQDYFRATLGGFLFSLWIGTFYVLFLKASPTYEICIASFLSGTVICVFFVRWRRRHLVNIASEPWDPEQGYGVALQFAAVYLSLFLILFLVNADWSLSYVMFISICGASLGIFFLTLRIPPFTTLAPHRWLAPYVFLFFYLRCSRSLEYSWLCLFQIGQVGLSSLYSWALRLHCHITSANHSCQKFHEQSCGEQKRIMRPSQKQIRIETVYRRNCLR